MEQATSWFLVGLVPTAPRQEFHECSLLMHMYEVDEQEAQMIRKHLLVYVANILKLSVASLIYKR